LIWVLFLVSHTPTYFMKTVLTTATLRNKIKQNVY
jgi:hypothetical protein